MVLNDGKSKSKTPELSAIAQADRNGTQLREGTETSSGGFKSAGFSTKNQKWQNQIVPNAAPEDPKKATDQTVTAIKLDPKK